MDFMVLLTGHNQDSYDGHGKVPCPTGCMCSFF